MERSEVLDAMGKLKLYGMRASYDEIITTAVKRQHEPQQIIGDLLAAEISEKQARSIKYQMTIAKLPLAKELEEFDFEATEINQTLIRDLATGDFLDHQRNLVLIGGTGTGKTHLAVSIARACIRNGRRGRFFNVVNLVNKLDAEARAERQGRTADLISRLDFLILDELGYPQELNDIPAIVARKDDAATFAAMITDSFDEMLEQSQAQSLVMGIALHPYIFGQPFRLRHLRSALTHICAAREEIWITTAGEIKEFYSEL